MRLAPVVRPAAVFCLSLLTLPGACPLAVAGGAATREADVPCVIESPDRLRHAPPRPVSDIVRLGPAERRALEGTRGRAAFDALRDPAPAVTSSGFIAALRREGYGGTNDKHPVVATNSGGEMFLAEESYSTALGTWALFIFTSVDGGWTWSGVYYEGATESFTQPAIAVDGAGHPWVTAIDTQSGTPRLFIGYGKNDNWTAYVFGNPASLPTPKNPSVAAEGDSARAYIAYTSPNTGAGSHENCVLVYTATGIDGSFYRDTRANTTKNEYYPRVALTTAKVVLASQLEFTPGSDDDIRIRSENRESGAWTITAAAQTADDERWPDLAAMTTTLGATTNDVYAVLTHTQSGNDDIQINYSTDGGVTWLAGAVNVQATSSAERYPSVGVAGGLVGGSGTVYVTFVKGGTAVQLASAVITNGTPGTWTTQQAVNDAAAAPVIEEWHATCVAPTRTGIARPRVVWQSSAGGPSNADGEYATLGALSTIATTPSWSPTDSVMVDGVQYRAPASFEFPADYVHNLNVAPVQAGSTDVRYLFDKWSDGGSQAHSFTAGTSGPVTFTASFVKQLRSTVTLSVMPGGTVAGAGAATITSVSLGQTSAFAALLGASYDVWADSGTAIAVAGVTAGSGPGERWWRDATGSTFTVTPTDPSGVYALAYYDQVFTLFRADAVPPGTPLTPSNFVRPTRTQFGASGSTAPLWDGQTATDWVDRATTVAYPLASTGSGASERWQVPSAPSFVTAGPETLDVAYSDQIRDTLAVATVVGATPLSSVNAAAVSRTQFGARSSVGTLWDGLTLVDWLDRGTAVAFDTTSSASDKLRQWMTPDLFVTPLGPGAVTARYYQQFHPIRVLQGTSTSNYATVLARQALGVAAAGARASGTWGDWCDSATTLTLSPTTSHGASTAGPASWAVTKWDSLIVTYANPAALTALLAGVGGTRVTLEWTSNKEPSVTGFNVLRSADSAGTYVRQNGALLPHSGTPSTGRSYSYVDSTGSPGTRYWYDVDMVFTDSTAVTRGPVSAMLGTTVAIEPPARTDDGGETLALLPLRPHPARGAVEIAYTLPERCAVRLDVFSADGRRVARLVDAVGERGTQRAVWRPGRPGEGGVAPGLYVIRLRAAGQSRTMRLVIAR